MQDILRTDFGDIAVLPGETEGAALKRAEEAFRNGVPPAAPEVQPGARPARVGCCPAAGGFFCNPGGCSNYHNFVSGGSFTTTSATNITIPLTYGTFQTVPLSRGRFAVSTSTST